MSKKLTPSERRDLALRGLQRLGYEQVYTNHQRVAFRLPESEFTLLAVEKNGDMFFVPRTKWLRKRSIGSEMRDRILEAGKEKNA